METTSIEQSRPFHFTNIVFNNLLC